MPFPRRVAIPATPTVTARTAMLPFTKVPGVIRFAYATLVSLGVLVGLGLETLLLTAHHYSAVRPILLSVARSRLGHSACRPCQHNGQVHPRALWRSCQSERLLADDAANGGHA